MKSDEDKILPEQWLTDSQWDILKPALMRIRNTQGPHERQSDRDFLTAVAYLIKNRSAWRELPKELGDWHAVYVRFRRWEETRVWAYLRRELDDRALRELEPIFKSQTRHGQRKKKGGYLTISERLMRALSMPVW
ncbi:MAG TPA: transposase [Opitutales bacterium]|nr:transposase [Opitutales bacterium]